MSSTTTFYGLYLPSIGDGTANGQLWGQQVNNNFTAIDTAMNGFCQKVNPRTTGTLEHGTAPNYFELESNGFPVQHGTALSWNDWNLPANGARVPVVGAPNFTTVIGGLELPQFAVNDILHLSAQEALHDWAEGTDWHIHCHWLTGGNNDATARGVKWEVEVGYANTDFSGTGLYQIAGTTILSAESAIPANALARSSFGTSIGVITPTGMTIGAQLVMKIKRIASVATAPAANPWLMSLGIHYQQNTPGSRSIATK